MRWLLFALCACNRIFGVNGDVAERDARQFDAPTDAQPYCPAFGVVPTFSPIAHEALDQECYGYTISGTRGLALARCVVASGLELVQGPIDTPLSEVVTGVDLGDDMYGIDGIHLSPEGDTIYTEAFDLTNITSTVRTYTRTGATTFTRGPDVTTSLLAGASTPSRGPDVHLLVFDRAATGLTEVVHSGGTWTPLRTIATPVAPNEVWLSPDGLRALALIGVPMPRLLYLERPQLDVDFVVHDPFTSLPAVGVFVTEDCTRAYMTSVAAVFYAPQI